MLIIRLENTSKKVRGEQVPISIYFHNKPKNINKRLMKEWYRWFFRVTEPVPDAHVNFMEPS